MTAKLSFKIVKTTFGHLYSMRIDGGDTKLTKGVDFFLYRARPSDVVWAGPAYLAKNGKAFRIGRLADQSLVAWKSVKISKRLAQGSFKMRTSATYKGDRVTSWQRKINGITYDFSRCQWANGSTDVTVFEHNKTTVLHQFHYDK